MCSSKTLNPDIGVSVNSSSAYMSWDSCLLCCLCKKLSVQSLNYVNRQVMVSPKTFGQVAHAVRVSETFRSSQTLNVFHCATR